MVSIAFIAQLSNVSHRKFLLLLIFANSDQNPKNNMYILADIFSYSKRIEEKKELCNEEII